jgi:hypothetical protein
MSQPCCLAILTLSRATILLAFDTIQLPEDLPSPRFTNNTCQTSLEVRLHFRIGRDRVPYASHRARYTRARADPQIWSMYTRPTCHFVDPNSSLHNLSRLIPPPRPYNILSDRDHGSDKNSTTNTPNVSICLASLSSQDRFQRHLTFFSTCDFIWLFTSPHIGPLRTFK